MIQTATPESFDKYLPGSEAGGRILSLAQTYGVDQPFLRFWRGEYGSAISLMDGHAVMEVRQEERDELFIFLTMQPEIRSVRTDEDSARLLAALWPRSRLTAGLIMTPQTPLSPSGGAVIVTSPRDLYPVLQAGFGEGLPPFDVWYADVSHRMRHGACRAAVVREGETLVSCAMTVAEWTDGAVMGAVATRPECRGKGYASACVTALADVLAKEGRQIYLCPKNEGAQRLYQQLGFTGCGRWGELCRA